MEKERKEGRGVELTRTPTPFSPAPFRYSKITAVACLSPVCTSFKLPEGFSERLQRQGLQKKDITDHSGQLGPPLPPKHWQFGYYLIYLKVSVGREVEDTGCEQHSQGEVNWLLGDLWGHVDFCTIRCQRTPSPGWPWLGYLGCCSLDKKKHFPEWAFTDNIIWKTHMAL